MGLVLWLRLGLGQEVHGQLLLLEHLLLSHASDLHRVKVNVRAGINLVRFGSLPGLGYMTADHVYSHHE